MQAVLSGRVPARPRNSARTRTSHSARSCGASSAGGDSLAAGPTGESALRLEMPLCEGTARTGFQVPLEADGPLLIRKLNEDVKLPRSPRGGVWTMASVVVRQPGFHIRGETDVESRNSVRVSQHVDESLVSWHGRRCRQTRCLTMNLQRWAESRCEFRRLAVSASDWSRGCSSFCPSSPRLRRGILRLHS